jgi:uncharacterized membrane protein
MTALRRHMRFLVALVLGLSVWVVGAYTGHEPVMRLLVAVNCYFITYLLLMLRLTLLTDVADLRRHAEADDEGSALILLLAVAAVATSVMAVFVVLSRAGGGLGQALFALAAVPLGWGLTHTLIAYRYAHLYYEPRTEPGLDFPHSTRPEPGVWDFLYFSFTIAMTAQVSDVQVTSPRMRKLVLAHGIGSFLYNTVILALAVNAGLALSR